MEYPAYFRKSGKCIKLLSPTRARVIVLPPDADVPERFTSTYPSEKRLLEDIQGFEQVDGDKFKDFLFTFYQGVDKERQALNNARV
jgi:hypothetical protein